MATVEDVIKVLEENGVPMSVDQLTNVLQEEESQRISDLLLSNKFIQIIIEIYTYYKSSKYINRSYELYWSKEDLIFYVETILKQERLTKQTGFNASRIQHLLLTNLSKLVGSENLVNTSEQREQTRFRLCKQNDQAEMVWATPTTQDILNLVIETNKYQIYVPSKLSTENDYLVIERFDHELSKTIELFRISTLKLMRNNPDISIRELIFRLNNLAIPTILPKPYSKQTILGILKQNEKHFEIENEKIKILINTDLVAAELLELGTKFDKDVEFDPDTAGLLSFQYNGNEFPLESAKEYIKLRKIIYLAKIAPKEKYSFFKIEIWDLLKESELYKFLMNLYHDDSTVLMWLENNITIKSYFDTKNYIDEIYPLLMSRFAPIFNLEDNPGNLFATTLRDMLESKGNESNE
ncbi:MAG: hypothetical protein FMNOHCHN_03970 [Ignavibacteriaceae bacterium]|nr:hypothetical protein [Ignavibacteriaceae bacterium]